MNTFKDIFELEFDGNIRRLIIKGVGNIEFDGTKLSFEPKGCCKFPFDLKKDSNLYIKKIFFTKMTELPLNEQVNSVSLSQNFLKYSYEILSEEFPFISKEDKQSRILLCKVFIELLEENNLSLSQAYVHTYIRLLELNLNLAEETNASKDDLYYALSKWLNACQNYQYTAFENNKLDREEKINEAIFINGNPKFCHIKEHIKKLIDTDERFKKLLKGLAENWYLKSRYNLYPTFIIFWSINKKLLFNLLLPRMFSAIIIGYILLAMAEETWKLAFNMWADKLSIVITVVLSLFAYFISYGYLWIEISKIGKYVRRRALHVFLIGFIESLLTGFFLCFLLNKYYTPQRLLPDLKLWQDLCFVYFSVNSTIFIYYPQVLSFFCPLALFIGIFVQIIWEDKPITHPL